MASLHREIVLEAPAEAVWQAVRDVGQAHRRLVPGVLTDVRLEPGARVVTFANGLQVKELIVSLDDERRRFAYAAVGGRASHHNASMQVLAEGPSRCRLVWTTDLLPDEVAGPVAALMDQGVAAMKKALEQGDG
jgi:carbon monoxide dehydrogenase subunit G